MTSKREIRAVRDDLARWSGRWAQSDDDFGIVGTIIVGLNAAARYHPRPHTAILAQLAADVARLESACLDNRKSCA